MRDTVYTYKRNPPPGLVAHLPGLILLPQLAGALVQAEAAQQRQRVLHDLVVGALHCAGVLSVPVRKIYIYI